MKTFLFVSEAKFEETSPKGALISGTFVELDKLSTPKKTVNGKTIHNVYRIEDADLIIRSLQGAPVYYNINWFGLHDHTKPNIGFVETVMKKGKKIIGKVRITAKNLIKKLKKGKRFLFSIGGNAEKETKKIVGNKIIRTLVKAFCTHLQLVPWGANVGFPNAQMKKLIEVQETVMFSESELKEIRETIEVIEDTKVVTPKITEEITDAIIPTPYSF